MPNWCENVVYIESTPEEIEAIIAAISSDDEKNLLNYLRPEEAHSPENGDGVMPNWYSWRVNNWGTKWEVDAEIVSHSVADGWINLMFNSAWSPPIEALEYWELQDSENRSYNIRYIEWGMAFCGEADSKRGSDHFNIPSTVADVEALIPLELNEEFSISETVAEWGEEELLEES